MDENSRDDSATRHFLRHSLATLAYRAGKTVRGTPEAFGQYRSATGSPSCVEILAHMGDLMDWLLRTVKGAPSFTSATPLPWEQEIARFYSSLKALDDYLASGAPILWEPERVFQGGIADALTHTGQLATQAPVGLQDEGRELRPSGHRRASGRHRADAPQSAV